MRKQNAKKRSNGFDFLFRKIRQLNGKNDRISNNFASSSNTPDSLLASGDQMNDNSKAFLRTGTSRGNKSKASAMPPSSSLQQQLQIVNKYKYQDPTGQYTQPYYSFQDQSGITFLSGTNGDYEFMFNLSGRSYLKFLKRLLRSNPGISIEVEDPSGTLGVDLNSVYSVQIGVSVQGNAIWQDVKFNPRTLGEYIVSTEPVVFVFKDPRTPNALLVSSFGEFLANSTVNFALQIKDSVTGIPSMGAFFNYSTEEAMEKGNGYPEKGYAGLPLEFQANSLTASWLNKPRSLKALRNLAVESATTYRYLENKQVTTMLSGPADEIPAPNVWNLSQTPTIGYIDEAAIDNLQASVVDAAWARNMTTSSNIQLRWPALDPEGNVFDPIPDSNLFSPSFLGL